MSRQPKRTAKTSAGRIPFLASWTQTNGVTRYRWSPSPRLRKGGWQGMDLGTDYAQAIIAALARNAEVEAWQQGRTTAALATGKASVAPRRASFADLIHEFNNYMSNRALLPDTHEDHLSPRTVSQYSSQISSLKTWAQNGETRLDAITADICNDLRSTLINGASPFTTAARLRMLRQLLGFAHQEGMIKSNPMDHVTIPSPPGRTKRAAIEAIEWLADFALSWVDDKEDIQGGTNLALAVLMGFYTTQREGDLLSANRINWRPVEDMDDYDRNALATNAGAPYGLRVRQRKTKKWVTCFLPPEVAVRVNTLIESRGAGWDGPLLQEDTPRVPRGRERTWPEWRFQRDYRALRVAAIQSAQAQDDEWLVDQLENLQYRDMRRSGMCWMRDMGVTIAQIAAISGHSIAYTTKILDTYMPSDPRGAAAGLASALRTRSKRQKATKTTAREAS